MVDERPGPGVPRGGRAARVARHDKGRDRRQHGDSCPLWHVGLYAGWKSHLQHRPVCGLGVVSGDLMEGGGGGSCV